MNPFMLNKNTTRVDDIFLGVTLHEIRVVVDLHKRKSKTRATEVCWRRIVLMPKLVANLRGRASK